MDALGDHLDGVFGAALDGDGTLVWEASQGGHGLDETVKCSGKTDVEALDGLGKKLQAMKDSRKGAAQKG